MNQSEHDTWSKGTNENKTHEQGKQKPIHMNFKIKDKHEYRLNAAEMWLFTDPGTVPESLLFYRENFLSSRLAHTREQRTVAH